MPETILDKNTRLLNFAKSKTELDNAEAELRELEARVEAVRLRHADALAAVEKTHAEAHVEEFAEAAIQAEVNDANHKAARQKHCNAIAKRKKDREARGEEACTPDKVKVVTLDGATHDVVSAHGLFLGTMGFSPDRKECTAGSRFTAACGYAVDAAHDELDDERFDQSKKPNCPGCGTALAMMDSGEIPDTRGDYLSSKEQIAHARAENKRRKTEGAAPQGRR